MTGLVECVPNFSEGRDRAVIDAIVGEVRDLAEVKVLDVNPDPSHNRTVLTFVAAPALAKEAAFRATAKAAALIDMEKHRGEHPRIGAMDVIPFIPLRGTTMAECVALARSLGEEIAEKLGIPIYLYDEAALISTRRHLHDIRRGGYEGLKTEIGRPERAPDFGPARMHPSAGATIVGARTFLLAYNINLGTSDVAVAKKIANAIREARGGFRYVRAMGVFIAERNMAQVTINMVNIEGTPLHRVFETVRSEAARYGVNVVGSEIVGLAPMQALLDAAAFYLRLEGFDARQVLENNL